MRHKILENASIRFLLRDTVFRREMICRRVVVVSFNAMEYKEIVWWLCMPKFVSELNPTYLK